jgi:hypothetical protein
MQGRSEIEVRFNGYIGRKKKEKREMPKSK